MNKYDIRNMKYEFNKYYEQIKNELLTIYFKDHILIYFYLLPACLRHSYHGYYILFHVFKFIKCTI